MKNSRNAGSYFMYAGYLYYTYITKPLKKTYLKFKYRKESNEVRRKYVKED